MNILWSSSSSFTVFFLIFETPPISYLTEYFLTIWTCLSFHPFEAAAAGARSAAAITPRWPTKTSSPPPPTPIFPASLSTPPPSRPTLPASQPPMKLQLVVGERHLRTPGLRTLKQDLFQTFKNVLNLCFSVKKTNKLNSKWWKKWKTKVLIRAPRLVVLYHCNQT